MDDEELLAAYREQLKERNVMISELSAENERLKQEIVLLEWELESRTYE